MSYSGDIICYIVVLAFLIALKIRIQTFSTKEVSSLLHIISDPLFKCCWFITETKFETFKYSDRWAKLSEMKINWTMGQSSLDSECKFLKPWNHCWA